MAKGRTPVDAAMGDAPAAMTAAPTIVTFEDTATLLEKLCSEQTRLRCRRAEAAELVNSSRARKKTFSNG